MQWPLSRCGFNFFFSSCINLTYYFGFICVLRGEDGEKEEKAKEDKGKQKLRQLHTHRYGEPEVQESAFWKKIIAYQQKLLVSCSLDYVFSCWQGNIPPYYSTNVKTNLHLMNLIFLSAVIHKKDIKAKV